MPKLRVLAQSTVFRFKGRSIDPQAVGRELNVRAVLTGRIMQSGGSLRIGTELVDVATGTQLWGAQYNRKPGDIFAIQDEISNEISGNLRLKLTRAEKKRLTKRQTEDRSVPSLPKGSTSLEPVDRRRLLQSHRIFSASGRQGSRLRAGLHGDCRFLRAPGVEQLSAAKGRVSKRKNGGIGCAAPRPRSRRSPHSSRRRVLAL